MSTLQEIIITDLTPRPLSQGLIPFGYGLQFERVLMYILLLGSIQIALTILYLTLVKHQSFIYLGLCLLMVVAGYFCYQRIQGIREITSTRKEVFIYGTPIHATIVDHSRKFVYYKSDRDYILHLRTNDTKQLIKLVCKNKSVIRTYPIGSKIIGLQYKNHQLFGPEVNRIFTIK